MPDRKRKYVRILKAELADLKEDIELLMADCLERGKHSQISQYVFLENMAVLHHEILDIDQVSHMLDKLDLDQFADVKELVAHLDQRFAEQVRHHNLVEAVYHLLKRKLDKVAHYVETATA